MNSFTYCIPTKVIFGPGTETQAGKAVREAGGTSVLVVYGGGSAVKSGLLARVTASLDAEGLPWQAVGGVQPNPLVDLAQQAVDRVRGTGVDFLLAVGGGSVIDTAKAIAITLAHDGIPLWDFFCRKAKVTGALSVGAVLTIAAAGSETSDSSVMTNGSTHEKRGVNTPFNRPRFAIMNPELTYTLPPRQTACGITDIMMHTMDRYFTCDSDNALTDALAEALLRTTIHYGRVAMAQPEDYKARSELMWCGSLSHNDLTGLGQTKDFSVHQLGHEISGMFDLPHGESLSIMWPAWARYVCQADPARFARFAREVWGIAEEDDEKAAELGIQATENYFREIGMPLTLGDRVGVQGAEVLTELARGCSRSGSRRVGVFRPIDQEDMYRIYAMVNR